MQDIPGKSLSKYVIDLLKLAKEKRLPDLYEVYNLKQGLPALHDEKTFCAIACAFIQCLLRNEWRIDAWVQPIEPGRYLGFVQFYGVKRSSQVLGREIDGNFEMHFITVLEYALNALPPAEQDNS